MSKATTQATPVRRLADCTPEISAEMNVRRQYPSQVLEWFKQAAPLVRATAQEVRILEDFGARKAANGTITLFEKTDIDKHREIANYRNGNLRDWLKDVIRMKIRLIAVEAFRQATGEDYRLADLAREYPWIYQADTRYYGLRTLDEDGIVEQGLAAIKALLDKEPARLMRRCDSSSLIQLDLYNCIAANLALWQSLEKQSPGLLPLIAQSLERRWIPLDANVFRSLKEGVFNEGYTERTWKTLCRLPIGHMRWLLSQYNIERALKLAAHLSECSNQIPPMELLRPMAAQQTMSYRPVATPPWFDAAAIAEAHARKKTGTAFAGEYQNALDWLRHYLQTGAVPDGHQKKAGWRWIAQQSQAWHEDQVRARVTNNYQWQSILATYQDGDYEVVPLTSSMDLAMEGQAMHHCVGSYADRCYRGYSRIFSIRKAGQRLATAEIVPTGSGWTLNQNRAHCNGNPGPEVMDVARRLAQHYTEAMLRAQKKHGT